MRDEPGAPRVAIAHDYLTQRGGAERVVLALSRIFPEAPIYTTLYDPAATYPEFDALDVRPSRLNRIGFLRRHHRAALPFLPWASRSIRIDADVVIASSSGWAHGFAMSGRSLVYCYSPPRWLYERHLYLGTNPSWMVKVALRILTPALKRWDQRAASQVDTYLAISSVTRKRIGRVYGRQVDVVPAPHGVAVESLSPRVRLDAVPESYFLVVSRLLPYKNVHEVVRAFADRPAINLVVVGAGPQKPELQREATHNVIFLENLTEDEMTSVYQGCSALIAASHEDFGLTPIEAAAHGKPSAVLRWGGFLDTVVEGVTGVFFETPTPEAIGRALDEVMNATWDERALRARAADFNEAAFAERIRAEVSRLLLAPPKLRRDRQNEQHD